MQAKCYDSITLHKEASVEIKGVLAADARAARVGGVELQAYYFRVIGACDGEYEARINKARCFASFFASLFAWPELMSFVFCGRDNRRRQCLSSTTTGT